MDNTGFPRQKTIKLVIKTPNQAHGDQTIEGVDMDWSVKELKTHLSRMYPNNPAESDQRLIYSGKLLPDHLHVRDIFRKTDLTPTVHLVCAVRTQPIGPLGARPKVRESEQQEAQTSAMPTGQNPEGASRAPSVPTELELRQRRPPAPSHTPPAAAWPGTTTLVAAEMTNPTFPTYSLYSPQQLLWLQHMYARQYYMQYHAAYAAAAASAPFAPAAGPSLPVAPHQAAIPAALPANQNAQDAAFINPGAANQNLRMNAQGGPVMEDEEDINRDWLDWVYTAARLGVFLSIVYFYSSLSRFILVMSSLLLMYLHTAGWFPFRRRPLVRGPNNQVPEVIQNHQDRNPVPPMEDPAGEEGAGAEAEVDEPHPLTAVLVPPHRVSIVWTAWIFFKAFFASLVPEALAVAN
ncbi:homocysteine-responsive endoplasmic reticulum-resident ubiquitin-like domain member 1 protein [Oncorhynchus kisutch]|uniref:Homocysteine-inducible, endoplasmic reticulum stress-inducible, ubiquitin-like domain member 1 n=1 Tax=Oncorhynchus kisutch TaxID=8019 RepID=A0A8C7C8Q8_ONCKI|nr:homocysteine-responsive endoplasmic reticulum-resident ubiquitin-like domain member 1 protein [Oncorhynchus kisutch]